MYSLCSIIHFTIQKAKGVIATRLNGQCKKTTNAKETYCGLEVSCKQLLHKHEILAATNMDVKTHERAPTLISVMHKTYTVIMEALS